MEPTNHKCIIVAAGDFQPVDLNRTEGDFLIACDAGFSYLENMGILPDLIVGDFDSLYETGPQYEEMLEEIRKQNPESVLQLDVHKDDTDTMKAVRIGLEKGYRRFYLYGALGGKRLDHTLANMQTLLFIKHHGAVGYIMESNQLLLIAENETIHFHTGMTGTLSVFVMGDQADGVTERGLQYGLDHVTLTNDYPIGVSNEFIAEEAAEVTVEQGTLLITVKWDSQK